MTDAERHERASDLFLGVLDLAPEAREAALAEEPDAQVVEAVRRLLRGHVDTSTDGPLDAPSLSPLASRLETRVIGREVGPWRITGRLGSGGMSVVYRAERADGLYEREVALKLLAPDALLTGGSWLADRLDSERRILARLEHPGIARLYDGGLTPDGLPYLAMELVHGEPITAWADHQALGVEDRVRLVAEVCDAVAYAHRRLVVHRDLKPGNILVEGGMREEGGMRDAAKGSGGLSTAERQPPHASPSRIPHPSDPRVKLLDFGVASLLGDGLDQATVRLAMTPAYAAPEQLRGEPVTTETDVYALGVVLYEMLTASRPYDLTTATAAEAERIVSDTVPPPPSAVAPEARRKALRGDLDTIVMKALEKEPERRYASAEALAADLRRHLGAIPIEARPATARYRLGRFVRRHRALASGAVIALVAVLGGSGVALWQAREAAHARDRAEERFAIAQEAARAMLYDVHDAIAGLDGSTPAREVIVSRSLHYLDRLASDAGDDPVLRLDLASAYFRIANVQGNPTNDNLGQTEAALASYRRGIALLPSPEEVPDSLAALALSTGARLHEKLGVTLAHAVAPDSGLADLDRALALHEQAHQRDPDDIDLLTYLATGHINRGDYSGHPYFPNVGQPDSALARYARARSLLERIPSGQETLFSLRMLGISHEREGTLLRDRGDLDGAVAPTRRALALRLRIAARDDATADARRDAGVSHEALGRLYLDSGRAPEAVQELQRALEIYETQRRANPRSDNARETAAFGHLHLGRALAAAGRRPEALPHLDAAVDILSDLARLAPDNARRQALAREALDARAAVR